MDLSLHKQGVTGTANARGFGQFDTSPSSAYGRSSISVHVLMPSILVAPTDEPASCPRPRPSWADALAGTDWTDVAAVATGVLVAVTAALVVAAIFAEALAQGREWAAMGSSAFPAAPAPSSSHTKPQ